MLSPVTVKTILLSGVVEEAEIEFESYPPILLLLLLIGCAEPVRLAEHKTVRIAQDSDSLQNMIRDEAKLQQTDPRPGNEAEVHQIQMAERHGQTPQRRQELLNALASAPGFDIAVATEADIQEITACRCTLSALYTNRLVKLRITSGPFRGRIGWICDDQVRRLNVWP